MMRVISCLLLALFAQAQSAPLAEALSQFHKGNYTAAKQLLSGVPAQDRNPAAQLYLALSRAATGDCPLVLSELHQQHTDLADLPLKRAAGLGFVQCALTHGNPGQAYLVLEELRAQFPTDADVLYLAARFHRKAWNDVLYALFQNAPASYRVNQISGEIFEMQGRLEEAASEFRKAIAKNPAALDLNFRLGRVLALQSTAPESLAAARQHFETELALNPGDAVSHYQVGQILLAEGQPEEAASRFEKALALNPEMVEALVALGKIASGRQRYAEAVDYLERATKLRPISEPALYNLMLAYRNAGRTRDAQAAEQRLKSLQQPSAGEFTEFLKKIGEKPQPQ